MASRRMFSKRITTSAKFLRMPISCQALYFHLGLFADDDGVVEAFPVLKMTGCTEDDLRVLVAKEFVVILNEDLVAFITDWTENNNIRQDRKVDSIYKDLVIQMIPDVKLLERKKKPDKCLTVDGQMTDNCQPNDGLGKDRLGKDSIGKDSIGEVSKEEKRKRFAPPTIEEVSDYVKRKGYNVDPEAFVAFYESKGWKVGSQPMKSWQGAVVTWSKRNGTSSNTKNNFSTQRDDDLDEWAENNQNDFYKKWGD